MGGDHGILDIFQGGSYITANVHIKKSSLSYLNNAVKLTCCGNED